MTGEAGWREVMDRAQTGAWHLQLELGPWVTEVVSPDVITTWVGEDVERARVVAALTSAKGATSSPVVRFLLEAFGTDEKVDAHLYFGYITGTWSGPESDRLAGFISQLEGWIAAASEPAAVKRWAVKVVAALKVQLEEARQREAEEWG
ncbi:hypothetical protein JS562_54320 [Agrobacterium sp. S2]|nr:hypothetical protein [Agrobacterium sp. S2]